MGTQTIERHLVAASPTRRRVMGLVFLLVAVAIWLFFGSSVPAGTTTTFGLNAGGATVEVPPLQLPAQATLNVMAVLCAAAAGYQLVRGFRNWTNLALGLVFGMLVFGYPAPQQLTREYTPRFDEKFILFENRYRQLDKTEFTEMFAERQSRLPAGKSMEGITTIGQATYLRKYTADFSMEMRRSVHEIMKVWLK